MKKNYGNDPKMSIIISESDNSDDEDIFPTAPTTFFSTTKSKFSIAFDQCYKILTPDPLPLGTSGKENKIIKENDGNGLLSLLDSRGLNIEQTKEMVLLSENEPSKRYISVETLPSTKSHATIIPELKSWNSVFEFLTPTNSPNNSPINTPKNNKIIEPKFTASLDISNNEDITILVDFELFDALIKLGSKIIGDNGNDNMDNF